MGFKILIADKFPENKIEEFTSLGCKVVYDPGLKEASLTKAVGDELPDIIIVRSTKVGKESIEANPKLNLIIRAGAGYNTIDIATASEQSVYVANCPGKNSIAVAELAFGLILSLDRKIPDNVADFRSGIWNKEKYSKADGIFGKTLGIIGTGMIGSEVISRAKAFGLKIAAWSRSLTPEKAENMDIEYCKDVKTLAGKADIISVHLALTNDTRGFLGEDFFNSMKEGACFVNTSRAEVIDEEALKNAVLSKKIRAGLDVFSGEPSSGTGNFKSDFSGIENVYCTHHIGASTKQAQNAISDEAVKIVKEYIATGSVRNCVNLLEKTSAKYMLCVHHFNRVGVLAGVLDIIRDSNTNVESMQNVIFSGAEGACANIQIDTALDSKTIKKIIESNKDILSASQYDIR